MSLIDKIKSKPPKQETCRRVKTKGGDWSTRCEAK